LFAIIFLSLTAAKPYRSRCAKANTAEWNSNKPQWIQLNGALLAVEAILFADLEC
jgi:hypothetical protein